MISTNPVLLKELRQSVRNRYVLAAYLLFLGLLLVVIGLMVSAWVDDHHGGRTDNTFGLSLFHTVFGIVTTLSILFIPGYVAVRLMRERWGNNLDLQFSTTIRPSSLAWGKVWSGLAVAGLLMSGAVPFMAFSYLLRGIDLPSIFLCVAMALGVLVLAIQAAVLFAAFPAARLVRAFVGLCAIGFQITLCIWVNAGAFELVSDGFGASLGSSDSLQALAIATCVGLSMLAGLHALCVAALSPSCADRMRPVRLTATVLWVLWGVGLGIATAVTGDNEYLEGWTMASFLVIAGFAVQATSERVESSRRILARVPHGPLRRIASFPFSTGQAQGLTWCLTLLVTTLLVRFATVTPTRSSHMSVDEGEAMLTFAMVVTSYALTVTLLWRTLLRRLLPCEHLWFLTATLILFGALIPSFHGVLSGRGGTGWSFGNIFAVDDADALPLALGWWILAVAFFVPLAVQSLRNYRNPLATVDRPGCEGQESGFVVQQE